MCKFEPRRLWSEMQGVSLNELTLGGSEAFQARIRRGAECGSQLPDKLRNQLLHERFRPLGCGDDVIQ